MADDEKPGQAPLTKEERFKLLRQSQKLLNKSKVGRTTLMETRHMQVVLYELVLSPHVEPLEKSACARTYRDLEMLRRLAKGRSTAIKAESETIKAKSKQFDAPISIASDVAA